MRSKSHKNFRLYSLIRSFKLYLYLASSLSVLSLITQGTAALAKTSQLAAIGPETASTTETVSDATKSTALTIEVSSMEAGEAMPAIAPQMAQAIPLTSLPNQTASRDAPEEEDFLQDETELTDDASFDQVTSVSQLSDVQPTDWAFEALRSLIERYGVIAGYPDGTYRGNRAMTRYEFAAALRAALDRIEQLTAAGAADKVPKDDLVKLQQLQQQFGAELATLRTRVDSVEARTAQLESHQFSTTTKLGSQVIFAANAGSFNGRRIVGPRGELIANQQPNATFIYRAALDFNTSFRGSDLLKLRLDTVSDLGRDNSAGFLEPNFASVLEYTVRGTPNKQFGISRLYYTFSPSKDISIALGPSIVTSDYMDTNSYANGNGVDFSTLAFSNNLLLFPIFGPSPGAYVNWNPGQGPFKVRALYAAGDGANPARGSNQQVNSLFFPFLANLLYPNGGGNRGLFGDPYQGTVELEYSPSKTFAVRLDYSGGNISNGRFDAFGANLELALNKQLALFGRYGYGSYKDTSFGDIHPNYWMAGLSFRDLFVARSVAGVAAGQPFIESAIGNATQTNIEAFYSFPISDNIRVTPAIQAIIHPSNQNSNGTIFTGTLRTVFFF